MSKWQYCALTGFEVPRSDGRSSNARNQIFNIKHQGSSSRFDNIPKASQPSYDTLLPSQVNSPSAPLVADGAGERGDMQMEHN